MTKRPWSSLFKGGVRRLKGGNCRQLIVRLDEETVEQIVARAEKENTSIAEQLRLLIEWGLEASHG